MFLCSPLFGEDTHFDSYFSDGLNFCEKTTLPDGLNDLEKILPFTRRYFY